MNVIAIQDLRKVFRGQHSTHEPGIVFQLDHLAIGEGEQVALVGPSGCGKTTLLHLIGGILQPDQGSVTVAGERIDRLPPVEKDRFRGKHIGYVFQDYNLVEALSAQENVMLGLRFGRAVPRIHWATRAREMLDRVGLGHRRRMRPAQLSNGERQRVAVARALVNHPPILLADEPTGSLDPPTARQIFSLLKDLCAEASLALLVVTHDEQLSHRLARRIDCSHLIHESDGPG